MTAAAITQIKQRVARIVVKIAFMTRRSGSTVGRSDDQPAPASSGRTDGHAPEMLGIATLLGQEDDYADEDQQR